MLFTHENIANQTIIIPAKVRASVSCVLAKDIFAELWHSFAFKSSVLETSVEDALAFKLGNAVLPSLDGNDYAISVSKDGICISASTEKNLIYGFMTLIDLFQMDADGNVTAPVCEIKESPRIKMRTVHFCVFHNVGLWELERFIRFCGVLKYSHILLEFWGMLKFDCLPELAWKEGYTKEEIKPLVKLANDLGMEVIPMFNHWGHAAMARYAIGKHVVLSQNPSLQYLFDENGWNWNIKSNRTKELLKNARRELIELCGEGGYFHIGCDESDGFEWNPENVSLVCEYINGIADELSQYGRRAIMWGDKILSPDDSYKVNNHYITKCPDKQSQECMIKWLDKSIIVADWQYDAKLCPVETSVMLKKCGFDVILASWDEYREPIAAIADTVIEGGLFGLMHTTWHTLSRGTPYISDAAVKCWNKNGLYNNVHSDFKTYAAASFRKCMYTPSYEQAGWAKEEICILNY